MMRPEHEADLRLRLISGVKWATVVRITSQAFSWIVTLAMVRLLSPHDYGLNAMIEVPIELLFLFSTLGIDAAIIRFGIKDSEQLASSFGYLLMLNVIFFIALLILADSIAEYFKEPRLTALIQVTSLVFVLVPFRTIPNALLDMALDFKLKSQVEFAASIISSITALMLALLGAGVWALVSVLLLGALLKAALLAYYRPWLVRPSLRIAPLRSLLMYGVIIMTGGAVGVIAGRALTILAGPHIGAEVLGFFAVASVFSMLPMSKVMPIVQQTMFPVIAQLSGRTELTKKYVLKSLELAALIIFPISVGMVCLSDHVVSVIFGEKWVAISSPLAVLAAMTPVRLVNQIIYAPLNAVGQAKVVTMIQTINLVVLAGGALSAASYGVMGLVWLTGFSVLVTTAVSMSAGHRVFGISLVDLADAVMPALSASLIMAIALLVAVQEFSALHGVIKLIFEVFCGILVYALSAWLFFRSKIQQIIDAFFNR